jgi:hypothetical protein
VAPGRPTEKAPVLYNAADLLSTSPLAFTINSPERH